MQKITTTTTTTTPCPAPRPSAPARRSSILPRAMAGVLLCACLGAGPGIARADAGSSPHDNHDNHDKHAGHGAHAPSLPAPGSVPAGTLPTVRAEVRKVEAVRGLVTLRHADIPNLDMPAMTMVFEVADPALLDGLRAGDRVAFTADHPPGGRMTVRSLAPAP